MLEKTFLPCSFLASRVNRNRSWSASMKINRITVDANQMSGVPCIRGLRIPVATVVEMVAQGLGDEAILSHYPDLEVEDIRQSLAYAAAAVRERELPLLSAT